jgi:hypothetical protein
VRSRNLGLGAHIRRAGPHFSLRPEDLPMMGTAVPNWKVSARMVFPDFAAVKSGSRKVLRFLTRIPEEDRQQVRKPISKADWLSTAAKALSRSKIIRSGSFNFTRWENPVLSRGLPTITDIPTRTECLFAVWITQRFSGPEGPIKVRRLLGGGNRLAPVIARLTQGCRRAPPIQEPESRRQAS